MDDDKLTQIKPTGKLPRSKDNAFNLRQLSMREFETFMILLMHDGIEQSILKRFIDIEFGKTRGKPMKSATKGYDYINNLCKKGFAIKEITTIKGKQVRRIYVETTIRKKYEKFMIPTISSLNDSINDIIKDYMDGLKEEEKIREKFKSYTETILQAINTVLEDIDTKNLNKKKLQKKITDTMWRYFRAEMLKTEMFSK